MEGRLALLLLAALLIGAAVVTRVWMAATGVYSQGDLALPLRAASAVALVSGFLLAGATVAWPMKKPRGPTNGHTGADS